MKHEYITPEDLDQVLKTTPALLIDVREQEEWDEHHIQGATLVPLSIIATQIDKICQDRNKPVYVYCQRGRRSHQAALILLSLGFVHIIELEGGVSNWLEKGLPCQTC